LPVLGALAAGEPMFQLHNTEVAQGALAGWRWPAWRPSSASRRAARRSASPTHHTPAEANVIERIANRSALEMLAEAVHSFPDGAARIQRAGVFAGLAMDPATSRSSAATFSCATLGRAHQRRGALAVGEPVRVGQTVQFQIPRRGGLARRHDRCSRRWRRA